MGSPFANGIQPGAPSSYDLWYGNQVMKNAPTSPEATLFRNTYPNYSAWQVPKANTPAQPAAAANTELFYGASPAPTPWNRSLFGSR